MRIARYVIPRLLVAFVTLLGVSVLIFGVMRFIPGGFEDMVLGPLASDAARERIRVKFGLDQSVAVQYFRWLGAAVQGDFGISLVTQKSVAAEILRRAPTTLQLALMATIIAITVGLSLGILAGLTNAGRFQRTLGRLIGALGASVPDFVLGTAFIFIFSVWSLGLTVGGFVPFDEDPITNLRAMALPAITLGVFGIALILRTSRDSVLNVMTEPHITAAVGRGETTGTIVRRHVLRNASVPILTVTATYLGYLLGGALIVEVLFSVPGVGLYVFKALGNRDYAIVQAGVLMAATIFIVINMLADVLYAILDPRIGSTKART